MDLVPKRSIHHARKFFGLIILHFRINVHSRLAVFMSRKILNGFRINRCVEKISDIGVAQLVRRHLKIQSVRRVWVVFLVRTQTWLYRCLNAWHIHILIICSLFGGADNHILRNPLEL